MAGVHDGYVLTKSVCMSPVGGRLLNTCLQKALESKGIQFRPRQTFKRVEKKGTVGEFQVKVGIDSLSWTQEGQHVAELGYLGYI